MRLYKFGLTRLAACLLLLAVVFAGCTKDEKSPAELLEMSLTNSGDVKTYNFAGSLKLGELTLPAGLTESDGASVFGMPASTLTGLKLSWTGVYSSEAKRTELKLVIGLGGDLPLNLTVPVISTPDKLWIKIPELGLFFPFLPEGMAGKFVEIDLKALAAASGQTVPAVDPGQAQKLIGEFLQIFLKHVDEETYLSFVEAAELGAPAELKIKQALRLQLGKDQLEPLVKTMVDKVIPEAIDLLAANEAYRNMLGLTPEQLADAKQKLDGARQQDVPEAFAGLKQHLKAFDAKSTFGINGDEYPVYNRTEVAVEWDQNGEPVKLAFQVDNQMTNINGDAVFEYEQIDPNDIIPLQQLQELLGGLLGGIAS